MARFGRYLGGALFPMQRYIADVACEIDPRTGSWYYDQVVILGPRRSGKTFLERSVIGERCSRETTRAMMTAQTGDLAADRWGDVVWRDKLSYRQHPELAQILHITTGNSNELCRWPNGSEFTPFPPKEHAIHGSDPDLVWISELWWFDLVVKRVLQNAYRPVWSVKPGQEWLESAGGTSRSMWLKAARLAGRESTHDPLARTAYFEWSLDFQGGPSSAELLAMTDQQLVDLVVSRHPRRDHGLRPEFLLGELRDPDSSRAEFVRAYGTIDTDDATSSLVPSETWKTHGTRDRIPHSDSGVLVGVGVAVDRRRSAVCAAWVRPDGVTVVEVVHAAAGQAWVADYVTAMPGVAALSVSARDGRKVLTAAELDGMEIAKYSSYEENAAGADLVARLVEDDRRDLLIGASPDLEAELVHAKQGKSGAIESASGEPVTCLQAAAAAVWAAEHAPEPEQRRGFWLV